MSIIGKVDSLWRYPVKSMRGEELDESFGIIYLTQFHSCAIIVHDDV